MGRPAVWAFAALQKRIEQAGPEKSLPKGASEDYGRLRRGKRLSGNPGLNRSQIGGERHEPSDASPHSRRRAGRAGRRRSAACRPAGPRREAIRARRHRQRDQDRQYRAVQRPAVERQPGAEIDGRLFQDDQRAGRHQRTQDQFHFLRRRLLAAEDGRDDAQAGGGGPGSVYRRRGRDADQQRDLALHEREQGAATVPVHRRHQMERPEGPSLDHGLSGELPDRGAHLCGLHPQAQARRQDRRALSERRFRQGLSEGADRRPRRQGVDDQGRGHLRNQRRDGRFRRSSR